MIAEVRPAIGGTPEAYATPKANGKATRATLTAAMRSLCQFSIRPARPVFGFFGIIEIALGILEVVR